MKRNIFLWVFVPCWLAQACCDGFSRPFTEIYSLSYEYADTNALFDSIYNIENEVKIWSKEMAGAQAGPPNNASGKLHLRLDATLPKSSFVFYYSSLPPDTLVIRHDFEIAYNKCDDYYFELKDLMVERATFRDTNCVYFNEGQCQSFSVFLQ